MKKKVMLLSFILCLLLSCRTEYEMQSKEKIGIQTQKNEESHLFLKEINLPIPGKVSSVMKNISNQSIYYGQIPKNDNGELIIFTHGFVSDISFILSDDNNMYKKAYESGYRTAFVNTTRLKGDWVNGKILASGIDQAIKKYNNSNAYLVVHSNGGKASEVALLKYNKIEKINRVISLGTPYWGTPLADLAQGNFSNWFIEKIIGSALTEGVKLSTTYYCKNVFRPTFDKHEKNYPEKFATLGVWGYNSGGSIFPNSVVLYASGNYMYYVNNPGIHNDGVTPYPSSARPGGKIILGEHASGGNLNHFEVARGQNTWDKFIKPYLKPPTVIKNITQSMNEEYRVMSNYQIFDNNNFNDDIVLNPDSKNVNIQVIKENDKGNIFLREEMLSRSFVTLSKNISNLRMSNYRGEKVKIEGNTKYVAFIEQSDILPIIYTIQNSLLLLEVSTRNKQNTKVTALAKRLSDLYGEGESEGEFPVLFRWNSQNKRFEYDTKDLPLGIYSLSIIAENKDEYYKRNLISGFTVGQLN
ncbi:esterase/lipase family protein [Elizabethkingia ursingii]